MDIHKEIKLERRLFLNETIESVKYYHLGRLLAFQYILNQGRQ